MELKLGLSLARQVPYHLSQVPSPFALIISQIGSCVFAWVSLDSDPSICLSHTEGIIGMHSVPGLIDKGVSLTFCHGWPQNTILPISASRVAGMTGMSHCF
jgi:hypothetical protein